jgi:hypothetical protein
MQRVDSDSHLANLDNKNVEWLNYPGTWTFYLVLIFIVKLCLSFMMSPEDTWTTTHVIHGVVSFAALHWIKGSPDEGSQGEYNSLTFWEQMDGGAAWTKNKKLFTLTETLLCFIACYRSNYNMSYIAVNFAVWIVCIVPKVPGMHQIRLFGLNTTVGIDDVKKE